MKARARLNLWPVWMEFVFADEYVCWTGCVQNLMWSRGDQCSYLRIQHLSSLMSGSVAGWCKGERPEYKTEAEKTWAKLLSLLRLLYLKMRVDQHEFQKLKWCPLTPVAHWSRTFAYLATFLNRALLVCLFALFPSRKINFKVWSRASNHKNFQH